MTDSGNSIQPTADQIAQQQTNAKLWNYYQESYKPLISSYAANITNPVNKAGELDKVAGQINAEVMKNVKPENASQNPVVNQKQLSKIAETKTEAQGVGELKTGIKQAADTQNVIDIGRGQATDATAALGSLAEQSIQQEIVQKETEMQSQAAVNNAVGATVGGAAAGAWHGMNKDTPAKTLSGSGKTILNYPDSDKPWIPDFGF